MDGLTCREYLLSEIKQNKDIRIDSDFYTAKIVYNKNLNYEKIGEHLLFTQYGISKDMNLCGAGYPVFRMNEIHHALCDIHTEKYAEISASEFEKVRLRDGDVLFNRTNAYNLVGRTGIYYDHGVPQTFASYLVRLVPKESLLPEYLTAFLNTDTGIQEIRRRSRQSIHQTNVNPEEVKEISIPILSIPFQKQIKACYTLADKLRIHAAEKYAEAEAILSSVWDGFPAEDTTPISILPLSATFLTTGRLDAEYYQPKYDEIIAGLHTKHTVSSLCKLHDETFLPDEKTLYPYIELSDIGRLGDINDTEPVAGGDLPSRARRKVKAGQVILSSVEGSLQSCALITEEYDNAICSTGFYVLTSDAINPETLLILFKSKPIQALLKQRCSGTILTSISRDELLTMPLPLVDEEIQRELSQKVQESFALRRQSEEYLAYAKQAVESAIEQGEDMAMLWLNGKIKN